MELVITALITILVMSISKQSHMISEMKAMKNIKLLAFWGFSLPWMLVVKIVFKGLVHRTRKRLKTEPNQHTVQFIF